MLYINCSMTSHEMIPSFPNQAGLGQKDNQFSRNDLMIIN